MKKTKGPAPNKTLDNRVKALRKKKLSFGEIASIMGVHRQTVYNRWLRVSKLSTGRK